MRLISIRNSLVFFTFLASNPLFAADLLSSYHDAISYSPQLQADLNTSLATAANVPINVGALLPSLSLSANAGVNNIQEVGANGTYNSANYEVTLTQLLFNYNSFANVSVAHYNKLSASATYTSQEQQFILSVATAYFNVLNAEYDVNLAQAQYDFLQKTLVQTKEKFTVGLGTYIDVAEAKAQADEAYATLVQNKNNLVIANENLRVLTGKLETNLATVTETFPIAYPAPNNLAYWVTLAQVQNPALLAQKYTESGALASINAAVGNELPNVFLEATYSKNFYNNQPSAVSANNQTANATIALGLTWTLFSGGELMSESLQAADQYVSQENTSLNLYRQTKSQTTQDYLSVLASIAQVKAYQQSQIAATSSLKDFDVKYKVGAATIIDILNATTQVYQARFDLAEAMNQYIDNLLTLKLDAGTLSEQDLVALNAHLVEVPEHSIGGKAF